MLKQQGLESLGQDKVPRQQRYWPSLVMVVSVLAALACSFSGATSSSAIERVVILTRLPTLTPTVMALSMPVAATPTSTSPLPTPSQPPLPTPTAAAPVPVEVNPVPPTPMLSQSVAPEEPVAEPLANPTASPSPLPTSTPTLNPAVPTKTPIVIPTVTPIPETPGWSFANIRTYRDQYEGGLLLYGDMINDTGAAQEVAFITGAFYDAQGQIIANQESTNEYWPVEVVPAGGRVPFELTVNGVGDSANYKLWVNSTVSSGSPRQDFNFSAVEQWSEDELYCLAGELQNPGGELREYLVIAAVLYDSQEKVVNFAETYESEPQGVGGDEYLTFEICLDPPYQDVARYELKAWGQ